MGIKIYTEATERIQRSWRRGVCRASLRERISKRNASNATTFERLQARLRIEWQRVCNRRRLLVHVPSFSVRRSIRDSTPHFPVDQSSHLASALCGLMDPNVDVIYVAPSPPPDDVVAQTFKMLEEGKVKDPRSRFRIVFPENHARLPTHFSLTMALLLSPKALKRIRLYSSGRTAILMPWHVAQSELDLAVELGLPLMGTHPDVSSQFGTKIGMRRILKDAGVSSSPAVAVSSEEEVISKMADLIVDRPLVPRWLVKIDDESGGRGHAFFDVLSINTIGIIITNIKQNIEEYAEGSVRRREATAEVRLVLSRSLATRMVMVAPSVHATWHSLVASMRDHKAIVEAVPGTVRGSPSANLFLDPCGNVSLLSTHEQVFEPEYRYVGALFPQRSVPHGAIVEAATQIGRACARAGVIGHVGVDFVVFEHKGRMRLWAVDLNLRPTRTHASYTLFHFLCEGLFQPALGRYSVGPGEEVGMHAHEEDPSRVRFYAVADAVSHPAFADLQRSGLLIACKRSELTFRPQDKEGVVWGASEGLSAGRMDVLAIATSGAKAAKNVTSALAFLADQIGKRGQMTEGRVERSFSNSRKAFSLIAERLEAKESTHTQPHSPNAAS